MKRREALKHIGLTAGFVVATPSLISILQSCTSDPETWTPVFFTKEQGIVIKNLADVILPKTDTPSASEVNVAEFIDKFSEEVLDVKDQEKLKVAMNDLIAKIKTDYNENLRKVTEENYKGLLDTSMLLDQSNTPKDKPLSISETLHHIKWMTIKAFKTSELVGETILAYDPIPGIPKVSCITVEEATGGVGWSLD
jgi:hypothetical protein